MKIFYNKKSKGGREVLAALGNPGGPKGGPAEPRVPRVSLDTPFLGALRSPRKGPKRIANARSNFPASFAFLLLLFSTLGWAETSLAERVEQTYRQFENFKATFVQTTHVDLLDKDVVKKGELAFTKNGAFWILYTGSSEREYRSDGKTLWIYRPQDKEVQVYPNLTEIVAEEALSFFNGVWEVSKNFDTKELKPKADLRSLELIPKKGQAAMKKIVLGINPETFLIQAITLYPKSGNVSRYQLGQIETNVSLPATHFAWRSKKGVKEVTLR